MYSELAQQEQLESAKQEGVPGGGSPGSNTLLECNTKVLSLISCSFSWFPQGKEVSVALAPGGFQGARSLAQFSFISCRMALFLPAVHLKEDEGTEHGAMWDGEQMKTSYNNACMRLL